MLTFIDKTPKKGYYSNAFARHSLQEADTLLPILCVGVSFVRRSLGEVGYFPEERHALTKYVVAVAQSVERRSVAAEAAGS